MSTTKSSPVNGTRKQCKRCHRSAAPGRDICKEHIFAVGSHGYVPAGPTRERIALLRSRGYGVAELARRTGLGAPTLQCNYDRVQIATQRAVMAVPVPPTVTDMSGWVSVIGTQRRVRALVAIGWPQLHIARRAGISDRRLSHILLDSRLISARNAARIAAVFNELQLTPGPDPRSRVRAEKNAWLPPLAWDEDMIDDPEAQPTCIDLNSPRLTRNGVPIPQDFAAIVADHRALRRSDAEIAERLGIKLDTLQSRMRRLERRAS